MALILIAKFIRVYTNVLAGMEIPLSQLLCNCTIPSIDPLALIPIAQLFVDGSLF